MRRFTLITIIALLAALIAAGVVQTMFFLQDDPAPVPTATPTE